jgi:hypothetical protein
LRVRSFQGKSSKAGFQGDAATFFISAAEIISPVITSTTFEARDRPYVTILKSSALSPLKHPNLPESRRPARSQELAGRISF